MIANYLTNLLKKFFAFWWPHTCVLCLSPSLNNNHLCEGCKASLPYLEHGCITCGHPLSRNQNQCGYCLKHKPLFDYFFALLEYKEIAIPLITELKFQQKLINAKILGSLMATKIYQFRKHDCKLPLPEYIIPIPLHSKRLTERGFNQSLEIARPIAKQLKIPINISSCKRIKNTTAQTLIPRKKRQKNIKNAFRINSNFKAKHIAIIDDVITTGNTVTEFARTLRKHGVEIIEVWCCAKTI